LQIADCKLQIEKQKKKKKKKQRADETSATRKTNTKYSAELVRFVWQKPI